MPRTRPQDFIQLDVPEHLAATPGAAWARWWRHRDGSVTHAHYSTDGSAVIFVVQRDRSTDMLAMFDGTPTAQRSRRS